jgi:hypothetical protein
MLLGHLTKFIVKWDHVLLALLKEQRLLLSLRWKCQYWMIPTIRHSPDKTYTTSMTELLREAKMLKKMMFFKTTSSLIALKPDDRIY